MRYFVFLFLVIYFGCSTTENVTDVQPKKMVLTSSSQLKDGNSPFSKSLAELKKGDTITVTGKWYSTYRAEFKGKTGYIFEMDVESLAEFTKRHNEELEKSEGLKEVSKFGTKVFVPKDSVGDAWGRAQVFLTKYSTMKIQIATDFVLETYNPTKSGGYGYEITKTPVPSGYEISVKCNTSYLSDKEQTQLNAHVCTYFIKTGIIKESLVKTY